MDFTNLEEKTREAKLDYSEAESLVSFFNFQRERQGDQPISADYSQLRERLTEIYPNAALARSAPKRSADICAARKRSASPSPVRL